MGVGRGYGKLILFGEHAAVYGHPALGVRLDDYLEVEYEERSPEAGWSLPRVGEREAAMIRDAITALPGAPRGGRLDVRGTLPMSVGFGSSAAFCTALLRATGAGGSFTPERLWTEAHRLEHFFHGTPSGIDTGLSIYEGASLVYPNPPGLPDRIAAQLPNATILVGAVARTSTTAELVAGLRTRREHDAAAVESALNLLGELSASAADRARTPDAEALGARADEAHDVLAGLGLSSPPLERAVTALRRSGAHGAKLSGAGGGGAFFGVFSDDETAAQATVALRARLLETGTPLLHLRSLRLG